MNYAQYDVNHMHWRRSGVKTISATSGIRGDSRGFKGSFFLGCPIYVLTFGMGQKINPCRGMVALARMAPLIIWMALELDLSDMHTSQMNDKPLSWKLAKKWQNDYLFSNSFCTNFVNLYFCTAILNMYIHSSYVPLYTNVKPYKFMESHKTIS